MKIMALTVVSLIMGCIYGMIFGLMDVEDSNYTTFARQLYSAEKYSLAIGVILGALGGVLNELIRRNVIICDFLCNHG